MTKYKIKFEVETIVEFEDFDMPKESIIDCAYEQLDIDYFDALDGDDIGFSTAWYFLGKPTSVEKVSE